MSTELETETVRYLRGEVDAVAEKLVDITIRCGTCLKAGQYAPTGVRVTVLSNLGCYYEFFCHSPVCRAYNKAWLDLEPATKLHDAGVPTRVIDVPAEVAEHPHPDAPGLSEDDLHVFLRFLKHIEDVAEGEVDEAGPVHRVPRKNRRAKPQG
jgi:hypothetical protein